MEQVILSVDDDGKFLEYIPKELGHTGEGRRHLAITVLLSNSKGKVLLQKRKHKIFDNIWDFTGATHPLHNSDGPASPDGGQGGTDESLEEATRRCLKEEWDISDIRDIKKLGEFNYFAQYGDLCENEHCAMMVGEYNGEINLDPKVGYEYKWMDKKEFLSDVESNPDKYTPWVIEGIKVLKQAEFLSAI